jgi:hypothetical protein
MVTFNISCRPRKCPKIGREIEQFFEFFKTSVTKHPVSVKFSTIFEFLFAPLPLFDAGVVTKCSRKTSKIIL